MIEILDVLHMMFSHMMITHMIITSRFCVFIKERETSIQCLLCSWSAQNLLIRFVRYTEIHIQNLYICEKSQSEQCDIKFLTESVSELSALDMYNRSVESWDSTEKQQLTVRNHSQNNVDILSHM